MKKVVAVILVGVALTYYQEKGTLSGHSDSVLSVAVAFAADGRTLASGSYDRTVKLWEAATRKELATLRGHTGPVRSVAFAPDGRTLASGGGGFSVVKLWEVATRKELAILGRWHEAGVYSVAFAPDGRTLASGGGDGTVRLWFAATEEEVAVAARQPSASGSSSSGGR
jgi:WD40 repeat protein